MSKLLQSFRVRLVLLFGSLSLLVGAATAFYFEQAASQEVAQSRGEVLHDVSRNIAHALAENLHERDREISLLSRFPVFRHSELHSPQLRLQLEDIKNSYRHYAWVGVADMAGTVRSAAGGLLVGQSVQQRPWFIQGRQGAYVGDVHQAVLLAKKLPNPNPNEPLRFVDFAAPILGPDGKVRGVLGSHANWGWVQEVVQRALSDKHASDGMQVLILNRKNEILFPYAAVGNPLPPALATIRDGYATMHWPSGTAYLTSKVDVDARSSTELGWQVVVRQPLAAALAPVKQLQQTLLLIALLASAIFMLCALWLATHLSRPIEQLVQVAQRVAQGDEGASFEAGKHSLELQKLGSSLREMTQQLLARKQALAESNRQLEQKVAARTAELSELYHLSPVGYHSHNAEGIITQINDRELQWLGYRREEVVGRLHVSQLLPPACRTEFAAQLAAMQQGQTVSTEDTEFLRQDGSALHVRVSANAHFDATGQFVFARSAVMDVTAQHSLEVALHSQQLLNQSIIHASDNGLLLYRADGQCVLANDAAASILGASRQALLEQNFHHIPSWQVNGLYQAALRTMAGRTERLLISGYSSFHKMVDCQVTLLPVAHEGMTMLLLVVKDVSELMQANRELEQLARHDPLTALANRRSANERLHVEFLRMQRSGTRYSVLLLDIDHFKRVNDSFGHETGDHVLQFVANLLHSGVRETDFAARFGGEEFLVLLPDTAPQHGLLVAEKLRASIAAASVPLVGQITVSIGLAAAAASDANENESLRRADKALYAAKHAGRNRVELAARDDIAAN
ncbi:diguanylate cyclase [Vogesella sp. GCM10023246]|uniref:Diguanylate cyclase n=1 Tax=Vogesella oryzagri TaxID=3160864 RepID=A0ABV1LZ78_9NEIS